MGGRQVRPGRAEAGVILYDEHHVSGPALALSGQTLYEACWTILPGNVSVNGTRIGNSSGSTSGSQSGCHQV